MMPPPLGDLTWNPRLPHRTQPVPLLGAQISKKSTKKTRRTERFNLASPDRQRKFHGCRMVSLSPTRKSLHFCVIFPLPQPKALSKFCFSWLFSSMWCSACEVCNTHDSMPGQLKQRSGIRDPFFLVLRLHYLLALPRGRLCLACWQNYWPFERMLRRTWKHDWASAQFVV